jgi:hypothetical protein
MLMPVHDHGHRAAGRRAPPLSAPPIRTLTLARAVGAALDQLAADAHLLAESARATCLPEASPRPFGEPLEDPDDYHRAFPSLGVPGAPSP